MSSDTLPQAKLTAIASFPYHYFLENIVVRGDSSMLVTVLNHRELWYIPSPSVHVPVDPLLLFTFAHPPMGIVEVEPDIFAICTSSLDMSHESYLHRLDLRDWSPGMSVNPEVVLPFPEPVCALNGCCLIAPKTLLVADSMASLIWRVDFPVDSDRATVRVWLKHGSMAYDPNGPLPDQPGVNGVRYAPKTNYLYYTSTAKKLFMRVYVDPETHDPAGEPEFVAGGMMGDDFCIDEYANVAYIATHRQNTIDRVSLEPSENSDVRQSVAGDPFTEQLVGPSSGAWGRRSGEYGRLAYFVTDGGTKSLRPDGIVQPAMVLRVEF